MDVNNIPQHTPFGPLNLLVGHPVQLSREAFRAVRVDLLASYWPRQALP